MAMIKKSVPLQAWSGPEGSRKFPDFMTMAQGGVKVVSHTHRPHLPPDALTSVLQGFGHFMAFNATFTFWHMQGC